MTTVNVYLTFNGNCREAFEFYKSVFGGELPYVGTFGEMPPQASYKLCGLRTVNHTEIPHYA
jgi:PhnB protein